MGKPRGDSTLDGLAPERRERIESWLLDENKGYREVRDLMAREWGVQTSHSAVGRYFTQRLVPRQLLEAKEAAVVMNGVGGPPSPSLRRAGPGSPGLRRGDDVFGEAALQRARMLGFMALMEPVPDAKAARVFLGIVDRIERRELAQGRLKLAERRERRQARRDAPRKRPKRTYEEKVEELCGIFGAAPEFYHAQVRRLEEEAAERARNAEMGVGTAAGCRSHEGGGAAAGGDEANGQGSGQPRMAPMAQIGAMVESREGSARAAGANATPEGRSETVPLQETEGTGVGTAAGCRSHDGGEAAIPSRSAEGGTAASEITSKITITSASGEGSAGKGVGSAAGCRSHGSEVSFGRVLGSETNAQAGRSESAPLQGGQQNSGHLSVTGRGVGGSSPGSAGAPGSFHVGTAGHAVIFAGEERGNYWPRPVW